MKDNKEIEQIFSTKLKGFEADVRPELWNNIAAQIGSTAAPAASIISVVSKIIIVTVASAIIAGAVYVGSINTNQPPEKFVAETKREAQKLDLIEKENDLTEEVKTIKESKIKEEPQVKTVLEEIELQGEVSAVVLDPITVAEPEKTGSVIIINEEKVEKEEERIDELEIETIQKEPNRPEEEIENYSISKMPDVFSPNNDGVNDFFFVINEGLSDFNVVIMNDKNETVFQSQKTDFKWDGNGLNGEQVVEGKYVYFIIAKDRKGNVVNKHSLLTIIR